MAPLIDVALLERPVAAVPFDPFPQPAGAEGIFLGRTRLERHPVHGCLQRLRYDAYHSMARLVLEHLAAEAVQRFGALAVRIHHAIGEVPPGQASVLVQVVCGHRAEALEACRYLIDELKQRAPIWKQEQWEDATSWSPGFAVPAP